jgi:hypothetical protein
MRRVMLAVAALAIPVSAVTVALGDAPAFAKAVTITCTSLSGTATGTITASGCTGGNTGGSSQPIQGTALETGGTITWLSGSTTTVGAPKLKPTSAKKCPVAGSSALKVSGAVTGDTGDGIKVPGKDSGAVCISPTGNVTSLKPFKLS